MPGKKKLQYAPTALDGFRRLLLAVMVTAIVLVAGPAPAHGLPDLDKSRYHTWEEVDAYLDAVATSPRLHRIVKLIPIGTTREGRPLRVLQISKKGVLGKRPATKPAAFIMGAHHAREHVSKESVLALIDRIIHKYGKKDAEGKAITYLVDAGTFYLLPWVNPDGGTNEFFHNPEQRKTNYATDEPQIGAADCDTCGDGSMDDDSPDTATGDVGILSASGFNLAFADNGIISRGLQLWYEDGNYDTPVLDARVARVQPGGSAYTFNYEGLDPDGDGEFSLYSGEDWVGGTDPNRNYGEPLWGDCAGDEGCSWLSGAQTYAGPAPFSEPETAAVAAFLRSHPNIGTLESLHSGVNEIYPPWYVYPDPPDNATMDEAYQDAVAQYISQTTGYEVVYGGQYAVKGDTTGYSYIGSSQDPEYDLDFFPGGVLSFTTEVYGMGSDSGSAEAVRDWFPDHWQQFDTNYPQGVFIAWSDFPWCTTCDPDEMPGPLGVFNYVQYAEYLIFNSEGQCDGDDAAGIFHCDYWGIAGSTDYYADLDIFAYFNPPAANRHYEDWNSDGAPLVRTVDRQIKHLLYRLYASPFIRFDDEQIAGEGNRLDLAVENTGFLRSSIMTTARYEEDPLSSRYYDCGNIDVEILLPVGFSITGSRKVNIGWLGGGILDDPEPRVKSARFTVRGMSTGDFFIARAGSDKTGQVLALVRVCRGKGNNGYRFKVLWTNHVKRSPAVDAFFTGSTEMIAMRAMGMGRTHGQIRAEMARARQNRLAYKRIQGPFDVVPGKAKGITIKKYH